MTDVSTVWSTPDSAGDWVLLPTGLQSGSDLETAVLISLFTDRLAAVDDVIPDGSGDRRGWWGDLGAQSAIGSKLWLLGRAKQTAQVLVLARQYAAEALQWLLDDGVVSSVEVVASYPRTGTLAIVVTLAQGGGQALSLSYSWVWQGAF